MTETYRSVVEMSQAIIRQSPFASSAKGESKVTGVLLDMAEIWELYVFHLLHEGLAEYEVTHTGREPTNERWLMMSIAGGMPLGGLKPDVLVRQRRSNAVIGVLDAKYKTTVPGPARPYGIMREDLYQIAAYLNAFYDDVPIAGILVYPSGSGAGIITRLQQGRWRLTGAEDRRLSFLGIDCSPQEVMQGAEAAEEEALALVRAGLG
jgi:5-methylcytosine-specific restriction enzyme subunit McrC